MSGASTQLEGLAQQWAGHSAPDAARSKQLAHAAAHALVRADLRRIPGAHREQQIRLAQRGLHFIESTASICECALNAPCYAGW